MADAELRAQERRALASGTHEDAARLLVARVRAGQLPAPRVRLAAALGDPPARLALPALAAPTPPPAPQPGPGWLGRLFGREPPAPPPTRFPDYPELRWVRAEERQRRMDEARAQGLLNERNEVQVQRSGGLVWVHALQVAGSPDHPPFLDGVCQGPKCLLRSLDEEVFQAAAACGRPALLRLALTAAREACADMFSADFRAQADDHPQAVVTLGEADACQAVLDLAGQALDHEAPTPTAGELMRRLEAAVERNQGRVRGIRLTGPDFGYTTRCLIACYLLADLLHAPEPRTWIEDARDVVSHAEGYFLELWTPHGRETAFATIGDEVVARAEERVCGAVRAAVLPWARGETSGLSPWPAGGLPGPR